jgi:DNA-binding NtrC family response regulator
MKCVILREDDRDLAELVTQLLQDAGYVVVVVLSVEDLLDEAARRAPCVALVDGSSQSSFDLWWIGPELARMGVPPIAFTAHASARQEFAVDPHDFVAVIPKPFDADEFLDIVNGVCWEGDEVAAL